MDEYTQYRIAAFLSRVLPLRFAYWLGLRFADYFYYNRAKDRQAVQSNLNHILAARGVAPSDQVVEGMCRKVFQYFGKYLVDFFRYERMSPRDIARMVSFENAEYLEACHRLGKGVILLTAHIGNWEFGGAVVSALGYPLNVVYYPEQLGRLNQMFQHQRERRGMRVIPLGSAARDIMRCLRRGEVVGLLADRDFTSQGDTIEFFGKPARLPRGPARLSVKMGAPVLPAFMLRQVDDSFLLKFHEPIFPERMSGVDEMQERIRDVLEKEIGERPHQWFIFDDFWKQHAGTMPEEGEG